MNAAVGAYASAVAALALRLSWTGWARNVGAEYDDLYQEGLIFVWLTLERGEHPSAEHIEHRMKNWIRTLLRQRLGTGDDVVTLNDELRGEG